MIIPHGPARSLNFSVPGIGIFLSLILGALGLYYISALAVNGLEDENSRKKLEFYAREFSHWQSTISALKKTEEEFRSLFSLGSREKVLENTNPFSSGSIDLEELKKRLAETVATVREIKDYLRLQNDLYRATPRGLPVAGRITSRFGKRANPLSGQVQFHEGIDISAPPGTPVRATAEGMVSYSARSGENGNLVVLEHGQGFSTLYAHNQKNRVKLGQRVQRGEVIAYVGSTGNSTGPHVHYAVWQNGREVDPERFIQGNSGAP